MRIHAIGDCVMTRPIADATAPTLEVLRQADLVVGNLEVVLTNQCRPCEKTSVLRASPDLADEYGRLGVDGWSLATNHALDYGISGLNDTLGAMSAAQLRHAGAGMTIDEAMTPAQLQARSGESVAFLNFCSALPTGSAATPNKPGVAPIRIDQSFEFDGPRLEEQPGSPPAVRSTARESDLARAEAAVAAARRHNDVVIVGIHWGVAWCFLPANQGPLAEYQQPLAHRLIDAGADIIVGHHPHAVHGIEYYGEGVILYSTGNFIFHDTTLPPPSERRPVVTSLKPILRSGPWYKSAIFAVDGAPGRFTVDAIPLELTEEGEPVLATESATCDLQRELTKLSAELRDPRTEEHHYAAAAQG